jgi:hypothetical protein
MTILILFNCKSEESNETQLKYESFISEGETINTSHYFCSITPMEIEYTYRKGKWTFKSSKGYKIAEGEYNVSTEMVWDGGGCPYKYTRNSVNLEKWEFWNEKGEIIEPTQKMINLIDPIQMNSENPFD